MDRRQFVTSFAASGLAALAWLRSMHAAVGAAVSSDAAESVSRGLIRAILPLEDVRFPKMTAEAVRLRMSAIFSLAGDEQFAAALALFDDLTLFLRPPAAIADQEIALFAPAGLPRNAIAGWLAGLVAEDAARFRSWSGRSSERRFAALDVGRQRSYLQLWTASALGTRRRFYRSVKAIVLATAYSSESVWRAIGYDGPLLSRAPQA